MFIHKKLITRLINTGVAAADAEQEAYAFYGRECDKCRGHRIGDSEPKFWDARIEEWLGTTPSTRTVSVGTHNAAVLARRRGYDS